MLLAIEGVTVHEGSHELTVSCGGEEYLMTEADFLSMGISESGEADTEKLRFASEKLSCIKKAETYLSYSDFSEKKLKEKLNGKFEEEIISAVINLLSEKGYIDDSSLAGRWADELVKTRYWGRIRIKNYLYEKGFRREDIENALGCVNEEALEENLSFLIGRESSGGKYDLSDGKSKVKLSNYLYRMGYSWDEIKQTLTRYEKE